MAIREFMSFFEVPNYGANVKLGTNYALSLPGLGKLLIKSVSGGGTQNSPGTSIATEGDGWLRIEEGGAAVNTAAMAGVYGNLKDWFTLSATSVFSIGSRVRITRANNQLAQSLTPMVSLSAGSDGGNRFDIFMVSDLTTAIPNFIGNGQNQYLEFTFDGPAGIIHRWIDGVAISPITITAALYSLIAETAGLRLAWGSASAFGAPFSNWIGAVFSIKDLVFIEKTDANLADDNRLGPRVVSQLPLGGVEAPWVASVGTALSVFNTPPGTNQASLNTPTVTTDELQTPAIIKLANTPLVGKIDALSITSIAVGVGGSTVALKPVVKVGNAEKAGMTAQLSPAWSYTSKLFMSSTTPAGTPWTAEALAALELSLAPV